MVRVQKKLLIIDPSEAMVELIYSSISDLEEVEVIGYCERVKDAIDTIEKEKPDIVTTEIEFNEKSGFEILEYIKNKNKDTKVVVITKSLDPKIREKVRRYPISDFLEKPFQPDFVRKRIIGVLEDLGLFSQDTNENPVFVRKYPFERLVLEGEIKDGEIPMKSIRRRERMPRKTQEAPRTEYETRTNQEEYENENTRTTPEKSEEDIQRDTNEQPHEEKTQREVHEQFLKDVSEDDDFVFVLDDDDDDEDDDEIVFEVAYEEHEEDLEASGAAFEVPKETKELQEVLKNTTKDDIEYVPEPVFDRAMDGQGLVDTSRDLNVSYGDEEHDEIVFDLEPEPIREVPLREDSPIPDLLKEIEKNKAKEAVEKAIQSTGYERDNIPNIINKGLIDIKEEDLFPKNEKSIKVSIAPPRTFGSIPELKEVPKIDNLNEPVLTEYEYDETEMEDENTSGFVRAAEKLNSFFNKLLKK